MLYARIMILQARFNLSNIDKINRLKDLLDKLEKVGRDRSEDLMAHYKPYDYQKRFHNTKAQQSLLMAGNRIGKSFSGAMELAYHLTGLYPEWWEGKRFDGPIRAWAGGASNETTRDVCQKELLGQSDDPTAYGTGSIPFKCIGTSVRKAGVPYAVISIAIRHCSKAWSRVAF